MGGIRQKKNILDVLLDSRAIDETQLKNAIRVARENNIDALSALIERCGADREKVMLTLKMLDEGLDFYNYLYSNKLINDNGYRRIFEMFKKGLDVENEIISSGWLTESEMAREISNYTGCDIIETVSVNESEVGAFHKKVPQESIEGYGAAVYGFDGKTARVVAGSIKAYNKARFYIENAGFETDFKIALPAIVKSLKLNKTAASDDNLENVKQMASDDAGASMGEGRDATEDLKISTLSEEERPIVKLLNTIIYNAIEKNSSDIHFEIYGRVARVKFRIDGVLVEIMKDIQRNYFAPIISRIKIMAGLDISEHRVPQDGRFQLKFEGREIDFRVSILPSIFGETAVIRILNQQSIKLDLIELGFYGEDLKKFINGINKPYGMVLVAGPTGSGKTTTLYAALKTVARPTDKIITIEDPVEYQIDDIVQIPVNEKKGLTFARGLRSIVRQDPDKIMVGEVRDADTAQIAVNAALTGHMVFSTIHANNVIDTISRLLNLGIEPYQFAASFNLIIAQRLLRKLCPACKVIDETTERDGAEFKNIKAYRAAGCPQCSNIGYRGRIAIFEILEMDDCVRQMIIDRVSPLKIREYAINNGMRTLRRAALDRVATAVTSISEIDRVTCREPEYK